MLESFSTELRSVTRCLRSYTFVSERCNEMDEEKAGGMEDMRKVKRTMNKREIMLIRVQRDKMRNNACGTMTR